jgi:hypothetical protein
MGFMPNTSPVTRAIGYRQVCYFMLINNSPKSWTHEEYAINQNFYIGHYPTYFLVL